MWSKIWLDLGGLAHVTLQLRLQLRWWRLRFMNATCVGDETTMVIHRADVNLQSGFRVKSHFADAINLAKWPLFCQQHSCLQRRDFHVPQWKSPSRTLDVICFVGVLNAAVTTATRLQYDRRATSMRPCDCDCLASNANRTNWSFGVARRSNLKCYCSATKYRTESRSRHVNTILTECQNSNFVIYSV